MAASGGSEFPTREVSPHFLPRADQLSPEFARLEAERLWPYVWQIACREEEIPGVGDYVTYDILDDSIVVVRSGESQIKAFHNFCTHRGRQLTQGCGRLKKFKCPFHGWEFGLNGDNIRVVDRSDFGDFFSDCDIALKQVKVDTWGGFVFINMDPECEPLAEFLKPIDEYCGKFNFENLRYRYYKTGIMPCNWKTAMGFFNEFYHVQQSHPQLIEHMEDYSASGGFGRHTAMWYDNDSIYPYQRSSRLPPAPRLDVREHIRGVVTEFHDNLGAMASGRAYRALARLEEIPNNLSDMEVLGEWGRIQMEEAEQEGAPWPTELTPEYILDSRLDWHMFPNTIYLHGSIDSVIWYRFRPNGHDPDSCIMDVWSLELYGEGKAPPLKREFYADWRDPAAKWGRILIQDFANMAAVQKGMKSRGFRGSYMNPVQELSVTHFYTCLREFMNEGPRAGSARWKSATKAALQAGKKTAVQESSNVAAE